MKFVELAAIRNAVLPIRKLDYSPNVIVSAMQKVLFAPYLYLYEVLGPGREDLSGHIYF